MKPRIFTSILLLALMVVTLTLFTSTVAHAQENAIFSVSPGSFTVTDVPLGTLITLTQQLVVQNGDTNARTVTIASEIPSQGSTTAGYEPIPNANWVIPYHSQIIINANSYATVQIVLSIPRWENLTEQKWEVWISVTREPLAGETGVLRPTVGIKIETATTLPLTKSMTYLTISEENFTLQSDESKILTATLTCNGNPVEREDINWSATAGTLATAISKTDTSGRVSVVYTAPSSETAVIVGASYSGSGQYEPSSASASGMITASAPAPSGVSPLVYVGIAVVIVVIVAAVLIRLPLWRSSSNKHPSC